MTALIPTFLPAGSSLYLYSYAKSAVPLADRLAAMAAHAAARYGPAAPTLVVPVGELEAYTNAQDDQVVRYNLLPSDHLGADLIGVLVPAAH